MPHSTQSLNPRTESRSPHVRIVEVGPRDGLQNISQRVPTATKTELIKRLLSSGLKTVELTSFVSARAIPQLNDGRAVLSDPGIQSLLLTQATRRSLQDPDALRLPVLVPNSIGLSKAIESSVQEVAVFVSAGEGFSRANIRCSSQEGIDRAKVVADEALAKGIAVRGYVSCIFVDPFDGPVPPAAVLNCVRQLLDMGCYEISLGDTLGVGVPAQVKQLIMYLVASGVPTGVLAGHFHDTYGQAVGNVSAGYECGLRVFDSSIAGLGGCPFAPGARGNAATEDLVYHFQQSGINTGVDLDKLVEVGVWISSMLKQPNGSRAGNALAIKHKLIEPAQQIPITISPATSPTLDWRPISTDGSLKIYQAGSTIKVVLNRPGNGNALTFDMCENLTDFFRKVSKDRSIKCVAITSSGKFFCTGMNLEKNSTAVSKDVSSSQQQFEALTALFEAIDKAPQITIACVQGPAFGGGVGLAFACDIRILASAAIFTLSEVKLGLCPATISKFVIREWGFAFAREAMLSGRSIPPSELLALGVVAKVEEDASKLAIALEEYVRRLNGCAPAAATMCKELVHLGWRDPGGHMQSEGVRRLFTEMMAEDAEAAYGVKKFQQGVRSIDWLAYSQSRLAAKL